MKKQITIDVPDGLPDGWECAGYAPPNTGDFMYHDEGKWIGPTKYDGWMPPALIAHRTETPADWANKQPKLKALLPYLTEAQNVRLSTTGSHLLDQGENVVDICAEECPQAMQDKYIRPFRGKWINA